MSEPSLNPIVFVKKGYRTNFVKPKRVFRSSAKCSRNCSRNTRRRCTKEDCTVPVCSEHSDLRNICDTCLQTDITTIFNQVQTLPGKQGRCKLCPSRGTISRTWCDSCKRHVCANHHKTIVWCICHHKTENVQNRLLHQTKSSERKAKAKTSPQLSKKEAPIENLLVVKTEPGQQVNAENPRTNRNRVQLAEPVEFPEPPQVVKIELLENVVIKMEPGEVTNENTGTNHNLVPLAEPVEGGKIQSPTMKCFKCNTTTRRTCGFENCGMPVCAQCSKKYSFCGEYPPRSYSCFQGSATPTLATQGNCVFCYPRKKSSQTKCSICRRFVCLPHRIIKIQCLHHAPPDLLKLRRRRRINRSRPQQSGDKTESTAKITVKFNFKKKQRS